MVGRDGLVANVAKYVGQQPVVGFNPFPRVNAGVLTPFAPASAPALLVAVVRGQMPIEERTMVAARTDDGQEMVALNDVYLGDPGTKARATSWRRPGAGLRSILERHHRGHGHRRYWMDAVARPRQGLRADLPRPRDDAKSGLVCARGLAVALHPGVAHRRSARCAGTADVDGDVGLARGVWGWD